MTSENHSEPVIKPPVATTSLNDLSILIGAHHPVILLEASELERGEVLIEAVAQQLELPWFRWRPGKGLFRSDSKVAVYGSEKLSSALAFAGAANHEALYLFPAIDDWDDAELVEDLAAVCKHFSRHRGALIFCGNHPKFPSALNHWAHRFVVTSPSEEELYDYINAVAEQLATRLSYTIELNEEDVSQVLRESRGLSFRELQRLLSEVIFRDRNLGDNLITALRDLRKRRLRESSSLELCDSRISLDDVHGISELRQWLESRRTAMLDPERALRYGLEAPRGLLLVGVPGCGKSLSAKAIAASFSLPLVRLDIGRIYGKYVGESENNFRQAIALLQSCRPCVVWVDEIEKAFAQSSDDGGLSQRIFGEFLYFLQEKPDGLFIVATSNDVSRLPPELLRKGRFDETFFVDLPDRAARHEILKGALQARKQQFHSLDLDEIAGLCQDFSGAELEQLVVSSLYRAFAHHRPITTEDLQVESQKTRPLARGIAPQLAKLRLWAEDNAVFADRQS